MSRTRPVESDAARIARLERMVFLMLSIMNGTIFSTGAHSGGSNMDAFGQDLKDLWRLQREAEGIEEESWVG